MALKMFAITRKHLMKCLKKAPNKHDCPKIPIQDPMIQKVDPTDNTAPVTQLCCVLF